MGGMGPGERGRTLGNLKMPNRAVDFEEDLYPFLEDYRY
jgi:hypothetical protein